jgi:hypothetical protein
MRFRKTVLRPDFVQVSSTVGVSLQKKEFLVDQLVSSDMSAARTELPRPSSDFRSAFSALPLKVIARHIAEERILRICPTIVPEWLYGLPVSQLERVYRRRMNARKSDSGTKTYVVETAEEIPIRIAELKVLFADFDKVAMIPDSRIDLDASREFAEVSA